jgi:tetratricopeptide (TPR) repeat protein
MDPDSPPQFLDVPTLLERSQPQPHHGVVWYAAGFFLLVVITSAYFSTQSAAMNQFVAFLSSVAMVGLMFAMGTATVVMARRQRNEMRQLEAIEELVQLRRWTDAALALQAMLSEPTRTPQARVQALFYLSSVLARYHRFEDAIAVHNHLLETVRFDENTAHGIRLGRAMAMLHEDHLVDADRAISELRRTSQDRKSAGLALVEIYRDVKTGHPNEAIELFHEALPYIRQQLGHRTGDAYALLAKAYELIGRDREARDAYEKATLLTPISELHRRYPEVVKLSAKYSPARAPAEAA